MREEKNVATQCLSLLHRTRHRTRRRHRTERSRRTRRRCKRRRKRHRRTEGLPAWDHSDDESIRKKNLLTYAFLIAPAVAPIVYMWGVL